MDEMVMDYLYDELSARDREAFEEALPAFPAIQSEVHGNQALRTSLGDVPAVALPTGVELQIMAEARKHLSDADPASFFARLAALFMQPAFATALLFVAVGATTALIGSQEDLAPAVEVSTTRPLQAAKAPSHVNAGRIAVAKADRALPPSKPAPVTTRAVPGPERAALAAADAVEAEEQPLVASAVPTRTKARRASRKSKRVKSERKGPPPQRTLSPNVQLVKKGADFFGKQQLAKAVRVHPDQEAPRPSASARMRARDSKSTGVALAKEGERNDASQPKPADADRDAPSMTPEDATEKTSYTSRADADLLARFKRLVKTHRLEAAEKLLRQISKRPSLKSKVPGLKRSIRRVKQARPAKKRAKPSKK